MTLQQCSSNNVHPQDACSVVFNKHYSAKSYIYLFTFISELMEENEESEDMSESKLEKNLSPAFSVKKLSQKNKVLDFM